MIWRFINILNFDQFYSVSICKLVLSKNKSGIYMHLINWKFYLKFIFKSKNTVEITSVLWENEENFGTNLVI